MERDEVKGFVDGERSVHTVLMNLFEEGEIDGIIRVSPKVSRLNRWKELRGIDFLIIKGTKGFPLEVKSSQQGLSDHRKKGRTVPVVIARVGNSEELDGRIRHLIHHDDYVSFWSADFFNLFNSLLEFSFNRLDLWRKYPPVFKAVQSEPQSKL